MSAQEFLSAISQAIYLVLFVVATVRFARRPAWATFDTFLFFAIIAAILLARDAAGLFGFEDHPALNTFTWIAISALPYVLLRLADDFRPRPTAVMAAASVLLAVVAFVGIVVPQPWDPGVRLIPIAYVATLGGYASYTFLRESAATVGITRRRMQAVAIGSGLLAAVLLVAGGGVVFPDLADVVGMVNQVLGLGVVLSYFVGFAPPLLLRRAWQEPDLRAILQEATSLVQLPDPHDVAARIQARVQAITGADGASIGLWDERAGQLVFRLPTGEVRTQAPGEWIGGRAFERQELVYTTRPERDAPEHAADYRSSGIHAIIAAPISTDGRRLGVLIVYAARPPLFTDDVLSTVQLMAEQSALVLRGQQLLRDAAQVQAMAEVTRLKDDFLSVVAHDVRTPMTTILLNAELLQQTLAPASAEGRRAASLRTEALRLKALVEDYLDVVRAQHEPAPRFERHDLVELVRETIGGMGDASGRVHIEASDPVLGRFDARRIAQLVQNLVGNGLKYSDPDGQVRVAISAQDGQALLAVTDSGIGIPEADLPRLFERFHRGSNADDRRFGGLGLGLYICRQIVEAHGGSISASSRVGEGSTFTARLALAPTDEKAPESSAAEVTE